MAPTTTKKTNDKNDNEIDTDNVVTTSFPPSHIADGRFIYLPPPNEYERSKCFERAIAKHGLLEADMAANKKELDQTTIKGGEEEEEEKKKEDEDKTAPKVHPLAAASARLQNNGINELNRAINLSTLVNTGEYFGLSNVVDPALENIIATGGGGGGEKETAATTTKETPAGSTTPAPGGATVSKEGDAPVTTAAVPAPPSSQAQKELQEEQRVKAAYVLKRKRAVFDQASRVLYRHEKRLAAAVQAQRIPDQRLLQLRRQWRLVAPEHGTRAKPHAVRPTEVVAVDVDVYDASGGGGGGGGGGGSNLAGRLTHHAPRYATVELTDDYNQRLKQQEKDGRIKKEDQEESDKMDADESADEKREKESSGITGIDEGDDDDKEDAFKYSDWTMAEPFAVIDPTLGRIAADFDPNKVTFLTLEFEIEKPRTGFRISSCLEPMTTTSISKMKVSKDKESTMSSTTDENAKEDNNNAKDERVLVSLQHSLFCAKLFEAIRQELMGDEDADDVSAKSRQQQQQQQPSTLSSHHSTVWLNSESEENFLPPPSVMVKPSSHSTGAALAVIHCHASEVKVQLDTEYTLRAKLVESNGDSGSTLSGTTDAQSSGSQSPEQLLVLCRSLLLHAQDAYHKHSLRASLEAAKKQRQEKEKKLHSSNAPRGLDRIQKQDARKQAKILQVVVSLGTKMLFEQRIRKSLMVRFKVQYCNPAI